MNLVKLMVVNVPNLTWPKFVLKYVSCRGHLSIYYCQKSGKHAFAKINFAIYSNGIARFAKWGLPCTYAGSL